MLRKWLRKRINRGEQGDLDSVGPPLSLGHAFLATGTQLAPALRRGSSQVWKALPPLPPPPPHLLGLNSFPQISYKSLLVAGSDNLTSIISLVGTSQPVHLLLHLGYDFGVREVGF